MPRSTLLSRPLRRASRSRRWAAAISTLALLLGGVTVAASTIEPSSFTTINGTLWSYLVAHAARTSSLQSCYSGPRPAQSYSCLKAALSTAGLAGRLRGNARTTLFAPTDAGFARLARALGPAPFGSLMRAPDKLKALLENLMVAGRYTTADLQASAVPATGRLSLPTLAGTRLELTFSHFASAGGRISVAVGSTFQPLWQTHLVGQAILLDNGSFIPMDMVYLPSDRR